MRLVVTRQNKVIQEIQVPLGSGKSSTDNIHYLIGRSPECHIVIDGLHVSRNHAQISFVGDIWNIKNISNHGDVILNGVSVRENNLSNGDIVKISDYFISIVSEEEGNIGEKILVSAPSTQEESSGNSTGIVEDDIQADQNLMPLEDEHGLKNEEGSNDIKLEASQGSVELTDSSGDNDDKIDGNEEGVEDFDFADEENSSKANFGIEHENEDPFGVEGEVPGSSHDDSDLGEETRIVRSFVEFELAISGEYANFDRYYINKEEVFIGRNHEKCQIILEDPECSQVHAVVIRKGTHCELQDLESTNGVLLNGARINQSQLSHGDEFLVGGTSFRFLVKSELISSEKSRLMPIEKFEEIEVEEIIEDEVDIITDESEGYGSLEGDDGRTKNSSQGGSLFSKGALQDPAKRKKVLIYAVVVVALWIFLSEENGQDNKDDLAKDSAPKNRGLEKDAGGQRDPKEDAAALENVKQKRLYENLPGDLQEYVRTNYELAKTEILDYGNFEQGLQYIDKINEYVDDFEQSRSLRITANEEFKKLEQLEKEKKRKQQEEEKKIRVTNLLEKADGAFEEKQVELVQSLLDKIAEVDPENLDASQLKLQLDAYVKEQERKILEEAQKKARRDRLVNKLKPGKNLYLKEEWYQAILRLGEFLTTKDSDDDLITEATKMLKESQENMRKKIDPMLRKARSLHEGRDLKGAYEIYKDILKIDPSSSESVGKMEEIKEKIENQARAIYREAIFAESLNYLKEAKEKFHEVQQISPSDSIYYNRAKKKLRTYNDEQ